MLQMFDPDVVEIRLLRLLGLQMYDPFGVTKIFDII
jgi:hypothetical protein